MIKFGTSGWRGIIADDFTFGNVRLVTQAIVEYIRKEKNDCNPSVIVGYDTRFLSEKFAETASQVLAANGIKALLCNRDTPTPVISYEIIRRHLSGGINFTASHNPPQYNGIKFSPAWGGPALPETTKVIEEQCAALDQSGVKTMDLNNAKKSGLLEKIDPMKPYFKRVKELVDFKAIKKGNLKIATDVLYGTGKGYLDALEAPREAVWALLFECITHNPRIDIQCEARAEYYAGLITATSMDIRPLQHPLKQNDAHEMDSDLWPSLTWETLVCMARRGSFEAVQILRDYVSYGQMWDEVLDIIADIDTPEALDRTVAILCWRIRNDGAVLLTW